MQSSWREEILAQFLEQKKLEKVRKLKGAYNYILISGNIIFPCETDLGMLFEMLHGTAPRAE